MSYQHKLFPKDIHSKYMVSKANKTLDIMKLDSLHKPSKVILIDYVPCFNKI